MAGHDHPRREYSAMRRLTAALLLAATALAAAAQDTPRAKSKGKGATPDAADSGSPATAPKDAKEVVSRTTHSVTINGKKIDYEAVAGTVVLKEEGGKARASIFYT